MKKVIISYLVFVVFLGFSFTAFAQTPTSSASQLQALIESLKKQIADLQAKVEAQKRATADVREAKKEVRETLTLIRELKQGMSGEEVKILQATLASDSEIYPEGKITGFFGTLTSKAVKRFQKKHGLEQIGNVGPKTLEKLKKELKNNQLSEEEEDEDEDEDSDGKKGKRLCAIVPPGHLIAKGWLKKHEKPIIPPCQEIPAGILKKLNLSTSTPSSTDSVAPNISGVSATSITSSSARIVWTTNEPATSKVWYSTSSPVQATGTTPMFQSASFVTAHDLAFSVLNASTTYYFVVESSDASGNKARATESSFLTGN